MRRRIGRQSETQSVWRDSMTGWTEQTRHSPLASKSKASLSTESSTLLSTLACAEKNLDFGLHTTLHYYTTLHTLHFTLYSAQWSMPPKVRTLSVTITDSVRKKQHKALKVRLLYPA